MTYFTKKIIQHAQMAAGLMALDISLGPSSAKTRVDAKKLLKEAGFPPIFLSQGYELEAVCGGRQGNRESWVAWQLYSLDEIIAYADKFDPKRDTSIEDYTREMFKREDYYGGPGKTFSRASCVKFSRGRVLVTHSGGLDI